MRERERRRNASLEETRRQDSLRREYRLSAEKRDLVL